MKGKIDEEKLEAEARKSCCRESFIVLERDPIIRIGAGARVGEEDDCLLFIEISLKLCPGKSAPSTVTLEKGLRLANELKKLGYEISCDEGDINFEKVVPRSEMNIEYHRVLAIIDEIKMTGPEAKDALTPIAA